MPWIDIYLNEKGEVRGPRDENGNVREGLDASKYEIKKNADLSPAQRAAKIQMIKDVLEIYTWRYLEDRPERYAKLPWDKCSSSGKIYGGAVRDLVRNPELLPWLPFPEDIDIKIYSSTGRGYAYRALIKMLKALGYTIADQDVVDYHYCDIENARLCNTILQKISDHPDFSDVRDEINELTTHFEATDSHVGKCNTDEFCALMEKIKARNPMAKIVLNDVLHIRSCDRLIVRNNKHDVCLNIDVTREIRDYISMFDLPLTPFDADINSLYLDSHLQIKSFIKTEQKFKNDNFRWDKIDHANHCIADGIITNILNGIFQAPAYSYLDYCTNPNNPRMQKLLAKGFRFVNNRAAQTGCDTDAVNAVRRKLVRPPYGYTVVPHAVYEYPVLVKDPVFKNINVDDSSSRDAEEPPEYNPKSRNPRAQKSKCKK